MNRNEMREILRDEPSRCTAFTFVYLDLLATKLESRIDLEGFAELVGSGCMCQTAEQREAAIELARAAQTFVHAARVARERGLV